MQRHLLTLLPQKSLSNGFQRPLGPWRVQGGALAFSFPSRPPDDRPVAEAGRIGYRPACHDACPSP